MSSKILFMLLALLVSLISWCLPKLTSVPIWRFVSNFPFLTLKIARTPAGPTLTFQISAYSLAADVRKIQQRPHPPGAEFKTAPLVHIGSEPNLTFLARFKRIYWANWQARRVDESYVEGYVSFLACRQSKLGQLSPCGVGQLWPWNRRSRIQTLLSPFLQSWCE